MYATIGTAVYKNDYWDNMEHYPDGRSNPAGKKRRSACKVVYLGISYGMGPKTLSEGVGCDTKEAKRIIDDFFKGFPGVQSWIEESKEQARKNGYVEDWYGRRRRLPDIKLPKYEIIDHNDDIDSEFNPFIICKDEQIKNPLIADYLNKLNNTKKWEDRDELINSAKKHKFEVKDNSGLIAKAELQAVNARVQGGAATMTKIAMKNIYHDEEMKRLGFRLKLAVHDELIGECPIENQQACADRLSYLMSHCIDNLFNVPNKPGFKCDADISEKWYYNDYCAEVTKEYKELLSMGLGEDARFEIYRRHTEMTHDELNKILNIVV